MKYFSLLSILLGFKLFAGSVTPELLEKLSNEATQAQSKAYAPYSKYYVGAALLTKSGKIFSGCNVENASYGLTNCAERTAVFKMISEGEKEIEAIVVVTKDGGTCCGACRQVLYEFNPKLSIICIDEQGQIKHETTLDQLLPSSWNSSSME